MAPSALTGSAWMFPDIDTRQRMESGFEFQLPFIALVSAVYLLVIGGLKQAIARRGKPFDLKPLLAVWNLFLAAMSLWLFVWLLAELRYNYAHTVSSSLWELSCDQHRRLEHASHIAPIVVVFYSKYLELFDTVLLALRGKPTPFIHVYHHAITVFFSWNAIVTHTCVTWVMTELNLGVHVLLYTYYALAACGVEIWFRRYLTMIQITQFVVTLVPAVVVLSARVAYTINPELTQFACNGSWSSAFIAIAILLSYLGLFLQLYLQRFKGGGDRKRGTGGASLSSAAAVTGEGEVLLPTAKRDQNFNAPSPIARHVESAPFTSPSHTAAGAAAAGGTGAGRHGAFATLRQRGVGSFEAESPQSGSG